MHPLDNREESDNEDWEAREHSRTHSVKFSEDSNADKETPFVRQNTPHPKELKAKAHKLFSKDKKEEELHLVALAEEVRIEDGVDCVFAKLCRLTAATRRHLSQQHIRTACGKRFASSQRERNCCSRRNPKRCHVTRRRKCKSNKKERRKAIMTWKLILN